MGARLSGYERLRSVSPLRDAVLRQQSAETSVTVIDHAPLHSGRLELLYYLNEQVVTTEYHRYGNVSGWGGCFF